MSLRNSAGNTLQLNCSVRIDAVATLQRWERQVSRQAFELLQMNTNGLLLMEWLVRRFSRCYGVAHRAEPIRPNSLVVQKPMGLPGHMLLLLKPINHQDDCCISSTIFHSPKSIGNGSALPINALPLCPCESFHIHCDSVTSFVLKCRARLEVSIESKPVLSCIRCFCSLGKTARSIYRSPSKYSTAADHLTKPSTDKPQLISMCLKSQDTYAICKHPADQAADRTVLGWLRPCSTALNERSLGQKLRPCDHIEKDDLSLPGQCVGCTLKPDFCTEERFARQAAMALQLYDYNETSSDGHPRRRNKRQRRQIWDSFGARMEVA